MTADLSRRSLFKAAGAVGATAALGERALAAPQPQQNQPGLQPSAVPRQRPAAAALHQPPGTPAYFFFNDLEARFVEAAVGRLIPRDEQWPGAEEAGVPVYIDQQLAGAYGSGYRMYLDGPWKQGTPQQGYQLPYTPAQLYRLAIDGLHKRLTQQGGRAFHELPPQVQDQVLKDLESNRLPLPQVPADVFFETLLANTIEGFFADPAYGGNRDMVAWKMIGFPGAYAAYVELVENHGLHFDREPISMVALPDHQAG